MPDNDLIVYKKAEEFLYRINPVLKKFPRCEKHALCQEIRLCIMGMLRCISLGNSVKSKRLTFLQEADGYLQNLKVLIKLSKHSKYISINLFEEFDLKEKESADATNQN